MSVSANTPPRRQEAEGGEDQTAPSDPYYGSHTHSTPLTGRQRSSPTSSVPSGRHWRDEIGPGREENRSVSPPGTSSQSQQAFQAPSYHYEATSSGLSHLLQPYQGSTSSSASGRGGRETGSGNQKDTLRSLIVQKEKELHEINEYRIQSLETTLQERDKELQDLQSKFGRLRDDFRYNLQLIEERDKELDEAEKHSQQLQQHLAEKDEENQRLYSSLHRSDEAYQKMQQQLKEAEEYYQRQINDIKSGMEQAKEAHEQEVRDWEREYQQMKEELEQRVQEKEKSIEYQRNELIQMYDSSIKEVKSEASQRLSKLQETIDGHCATIKEYESTLANVRRELKDRDDEKNDVQQSKSKLEMQVRDLQKDAEETENHWSRRVDQLNSEKEELYEQKQSIIDEYEAKLERLSNQLYDFQNSLHDEQQRHQREFQEMKSQLESQHDRETRELQQEKSSVERECIELREQLESSNDAFENKKTELDRYLKHYHQELNESNNYTEELQREIHNQKSKVAELEKAKVDLQTDVETRDDTITRLRAEVSDLKQQISSLQHELELNNSTWNERWESRNKALKEQMQNESEALRKQRDESLRRQQESQEEVQKKQQTINDLREQIADLNAQLRSKKTTETAAQLTRQHQGNTALAPGRESSPAANRVQGHYSSPVFSQDYGPASEIFDVGTEAWHNNTPGKLADSSSGVDYQRYLEARQQVSTLQDKNTELQQQCSRFREIIGEMRQQIHDLEQQKQAEESTTSAHHQHASQGVVQPVQEHRAQDPLYPHWIQQERDGLQNTIQRLRRYIGSLERRADASSKALRSRGDDDFREAFESLQDECKTLRGLLMEAENENQNLRQSVNALYEEMGHHEPPREQNDVVQDTLGIDELQQRHENNTSEVEQRLEQTREELKRIVSERDQLLDLSNSLRAQMRRQSKTSHGGAAQNGNTLRTSYGMHERDTDGGHEAESTSQNKLRALENELQSVAASNEQLRKQLKEWIDKHNKEAYSSRSEKRNKCSSASPKWKRADARKEGTEGTAPSTKMKTTTRTPYDSSGHWRERVDDFILQGHRPSGQDAHGRDSSSRRVMNYNYKAHQ
eukprot:gb/GECG01004004.1/.p1 GENE.gb/GECG01004004.1/~~gb/GECG01004004.1/.p1  ORF type:complete len:1089 (+),score=223.89 gb/GECG01004004.1/:1-3267(+)